VLRFGFLIATPSTNSTHFLYCPRIRRLPRSSGFRRCQSTPLKDTYIFRTPYSPPYRLEPVPVFRDGYLESEQFSFPDFFSFNLFFPLFFLATQPKKTKPKTTKKGGGRGVCSVHFSSILFIFKVRLGPGPCSRFKVPVSYSPPSVDGYTQTPSHYHPCSTVRVQITPSGRVIPLFPDYLHAEVGDAGNLSLPVCIFFFPKKGGGRGKKGGK